MKEFEKKEGDKVSIDLQKLEKLKNLNDDAFLLHRWKNKYFEKTFIVDLVEEIEKKLKLVQIGLTEFDHTDSLALVFLNDLYLFYCNEELIEL